MQSDLNDNQTGETSNNFFHKWSAQHDNTPQLTGAPEAAEEAPVLQGQAAGQPQAHAPQGPPAKAAPLKKAGPPNATPKATHKAAPRTPQRTGGLTSPAGAPVSLGPQQDRSPDSVEKQMEQAGDAFKVPKRTRIKVTMADWVSKWSSEEKWDPTLKRHKLPFTRDGIKLEEWAKSLSGGKIVDGTIDGYVQGAEDFLETLDIELEDGMRLDEFDHLDLVRQVRCLLMH